MQASNVTGSGIVRLNSSLKWLSVFRTI